MEVDGQLRAPAALIQGKGPPIPMEHENGWAPSPFCVVWEKEKSLSFSAGVESRFLGRPARNVVTVLTALSGFRTVYGR
jgi:hypothetical protein